MQNYAFPGGAYLDHGIVETVFISFIISTLISSFLSYTIRESEVKWSAGI